MARYETVVEDGTVYVATADDRLEVGELETIVELVGGRAWTIEYSDREKQAHPELNTADEGLTVDVVDTVNAMTFGEGFVETLAAQPGEWGGSGGDVTGGDGAGSARRGSGDGGSDGWDSDGAGAANGIVRGDGVSPRLGLFVGRLLENLEYGLR